MEQHLKRLVGLALAGFFVWKSVTWYQGRGAAHQFTFRAEGPPLCPVEFRYGVGDTLREDSQSLAWQGEALASRGHQTVHLQAHSPLRCELQPSQLRCFIDRDGLPWKTGQTRRITDSQDSSLLGVRCEVSADAAE